MSQTNWPVLRMSWKIVVSFLQKQADQLEKLKEQLATAKEKASQTQEELETAKEKVQKLLADYQICAKEQEEQKLPIKLSKVNSLTVWIVSKQAG